MEMNRTDSEDWISLYEAAMKGCTTTLNRLMQKDKLILHKVSVSSFTETPLHISALLGHLDFTRAIIQLNPKMALELDSHQRSPLHLAAAEGHTEIVKALLRVKNGVCLIRDQDDRIALHLAAMRGRIEVIQELLAPSPRSVSETLDGGTILHLCVKYNQLEALNVLIMFMTMQEIDIFKGNQDGNTILHLSAILKQTKTIRYLLSLPGVKSRVNSVNEMGLTALDLLDQYSKQDYKSLEIQNILIQAGGRRSEELSSSYFDSKERSINCSTDIFSRTKKLSSKSESWFRKCMKFLEYDREETRGALMIVATVMATVTFQAALNPPGGVWQQNFTSTRGGFECNEKNVCEAGTSVLAYAYPKSYLNFLICNTLAFLASLSVIALIVGGFPLRNKLCVWILAQAISITVVLLSLSYSTAIFIVTPPSLRFKISKSFPEFYWVWIGIISLATVMEAIRFIAWMVKKLRKCWRKIVKTYRKHGLIEL